MAFLIALFLTPLSGQVQPGKANPFAGGSGDVATLAVKAGGTGSVATTVAEKLDRTVDVLDFMTSAQRAKVVAGTTDFDCTPAFTAAIARASAIGGATVNIPAGKYAANIVLASPGVNLKGNSLLTNGSNGWNYICPWDITKPTLQVGDGTAFLMGGYVSNISLFGIGPNGVGIKGLYMPGGCQDWYFSQMSIRRHATNQIHITSAATYYNEYIQFSQVRIDGATTTPNQSVIRVDNGASWVAAVSFDGYGVQSGTNEPAYYLDSTIIWLTNGWTQCASSGTNCAGIKLAKTGSQNPGVWAHNSVLEVTGGGVALELHHTTARKNVSQYIHGELSFAPSGSVNMKSADASIVSISCDSTVKLPYRSEAWTPVIIDELFFADGATPILTENSAYIRQDSSSRLILNNPTASSGIVAIQSVFGGIGTSNPDSKWEIVTSAGTAVGGLKQRVSTTNTGGGLKDLIAEGTATLSGSSTTITLSIPSNSRLIGVQLRVDTAVTSATATSWTAAFSGGSTASIGSGQAFAKNTKFDLMVAGSTANTTGTTNIAITPNTGTFTGGVIRAVVYYETLVPLSNQP